MTQARHHSVADIPTHLLVAVAVVVALGTALALAPVTIGDGMLAVRCVVALVSSNGPSAFRSGIAFHHTAGDFHIARNIACRRIDAVQL